jgi:hypothetical protein
MKPPYRDLQPLDLFPSNCTGWTLTLGATLFAASASAVPTLTVSDGMTSTTVTVGICGLFNGLTHGYDPRLVCKSASRIVVKVGLGW